MNRWNTRRIDQLGRVVTGKTPPSERPEEFGDQFPFITPSDIPGTQKYITTERFLSEKGMESFRRMQLPPKSVCVVCIGATIGKVCQVTTPSVANQQINSIIPTKGETDADFAYYLSTTLKDALVSFAGGSATPIINKSAFSAIKVQVPEYPTQRKIAAVLAAYDDLIEANRRRIALLERMAEEIYREWFVRLRFPGHATTKITKGLPAGWTWQKLPEIADITYGFPFDGARFNADGRGKPIIRIRNIPDSSSHDFTDEAAADKYVVRSGDLLIGMDGEFHINCWHGPEAYLVQRVCRLRAKSPMLEGYMGHAIRGPVKHYESILMGATVGHLGAMHLKGIEILVPPSPILNELGIFNQLNQQIGTLEQANRRLTRTRDLLLPRLISGKLSVESLAIAFPPSMAVNEPT